MCAACEPGAAEQRGIAPQLLRRARDIERKRLGRPVSEQAWCILAGSTGGAIAWPDYRRMLECLDAAAQARPGLTCEEA